MRPLRLLWIAVLAPACQETSSPAEAMAPAVSVPTMAAKAQPTSPFVWRARSSDGSGRPVAEARSSAGGLEAQVPGVACEYAVEPAEPCDEATCQLGKLWCTMGSHAVQTRTLCMQAVNGSDSGTSNLRIVHDGASRLLELGCASRGRGEPLRVRVPPRVDAIPAPADPSASAGSLAVAASAASTAARSPSPFRWALQVIDAEGASSDVPVTGSEGAIAGVSDGWSCRYALVPGTDRDFVSLEFGILRCARSDGPMFETVVVCGLPPSRSTYRNVASLDLARDGRATTTFMMTCETP